VFKDERVSTYFEVGSTPACLLPACLLPVVCLSPLTPRPTCGLQELNQLIEDAFQNPSQARAKACFGYCLPVRLMGGCEQIDSEPFTKRMSDLSECVAVILLQC
jgi:hypothetical protein